MVNMNLNTLIAIISRGPKKITGGPKFARRPAVGPRWVIGNGNSVLNVVVAISGYFAIISIQNTGRVVVSNVVFRLPSFAIFRS